MENLLPAVGQLPKIKLRLFTIRLCKYTDRLEAWDDYSL